MHYILRKVKDFESIRKACDASSAISKTVIDGFLLYHAVTKYNMGRTLTEAFSVYRHITIEFEKEWVSMFKTQYIANQIFRSGGLIRKILSHPELKKLSRKEIEFL